MKRDFQIQFCQAQGLRPEHYLLDVGCGTLRGGLPLIAYLETGHYFGVEPRLAALRAANEELRESGLEFKQPQLIHAASLAEVALPQRFDVAWAFSVFMHLTDERLQETFAGVSKHLQTNGRFYANVSWRSGKARRWREFPLIARSVKTYAEMAERYGLITTNLGSLREFGHYTGNPDQDDQRMLCFTRCYRSGVDGCLGRPLRH